MKGDADSRLPLVPISSEERKELSVIKERFISLAISLMDAAQLPIDLFEVYPETDDLDELYEQLMDLKKCLDSFRPFDPAQVVNLKEVFDTEYTYASNRIEGNTLTLRETSFIINEGLTHRNKSMREHLEVVNHKEAIDFVRELVSAAEPLSEWTIKLIRALVLQGIDRKNAGVYRGISVGMRGTDIIFPEPYIVPKLMEDLMLYYEDNKDSMHPVQLAAHMHFKLIDIHQFIDENGRTCRLVMNLILLQRGYPVTIFSPEAEARDRYFNALNDVREYNDLSFFERFVADSTKHWLFTYLKMMAPNTSESSKDNGYCFSKNRALFEGMS